MLTVQHTVWVREHNRVAAELKLINPGWRGERLFQETRRIVTAEWQHIVYNEWLHIVIGTSYMRTFNLQPVTSGYSLDRDPGFNPRINNEFATPTFRFGHTLITPNIPTRDRRGRNTTQFDLRNMFSNSQELANRAFIEDVTQGLSQSEIPAFDGNFVDDVINHLFEAGGGQGVDGGLDLTALNILRGRGHGTPGYNQFREVCASTFYNFNKVPSIRQLTEGGWLSSGDVNSLRAVYQTVDDIDLFAGAILENAHKDGLVGPTFKCIIGDQFVRLKRGDRFWYERGDGRNTRFTLDQLGELRKASMARIMCDNTEIQRTQPLVFRMPAPGNELVGCRDGSIPRLNLALLFRGLLN